MSESPPRFGLAELLSAGAAAIVAISILVWPLAIGPQFAAMFEDFGSTLPTLTRMALEPWVNVVVLVLLSVGIGLTFVPQRRGVRVGVAATALMLGCLVHVAYLVAMYLPIFELAGNID